MECSTGGSFGMDTSEILKFDYDDQNNKLWSENLDEIAGHFGWDDSDPDNIGVSKPATKNNHLHAASKNLHSEIKRRKKLNDTLYTLRSVVPKISKMDKQSIIEDAISYVSDLQKKIQEIEGEIEGLCSSKKGDYHTQITLEMIKLPNYVLEKRSTKESDDANKSMDKLKHGKILERSKVLVYANRMEEDILLHEELDERARLHSNYFHVWYVINKCVGDGWRYSLGHIRHEILKEHIPEGSEGTLASLCGPPPMIQLACLPNLENMKYDLETSCFEF